MANDGSCEQSDSDGDSQPGVGSVEGRRGGDVSLDTAFSLLSHRSRRLVLRFFLERPGNETRLGDLVEFVHQRTPEGTDRSDVEISLRHNHLQKLDDANVVAYDEATGSASYEGSRLVERLLAVATAERSPS